MMAMIGQPKLKASGISQIFTTREGSFSALDDFNLSVEENEFATIVGASGCGKSTFLSIAAGLLRPTSGEVQVDGRAITGPGRDRGMVFQSYTLFPWLTVEDNVAFALKKERMPETEKRQRVELFLEQVGLSSFKKSYPNQLSGGMKQRVAIARALVYHPAVLLMDEPFGALDALTRSSMQELLLEVWEKNKTTVVFITHDVDEAILLSDRVYVMSSRPGRVKREIDVDLPRPRPLELTTTDAFQALKRQVMGLIRE
jgi:ABC-type nitrate/sulfonate/bicarbonate transport system ATPase subunit